MTAIWWEYFVRQWNDHTQIETGTPYWRRFVMAYRMAWCAVFITHWQGYPRLYWLWELLCWGYSRKRAKRRALAEESPE